VLSLVLFKTIAIKQYIYIVVIVVVVVVVIVIGVFYHNHIIIVVIHGLFDAGRCDGGRCGQRLWARCRLPGPPWISVASRPFIPTQSRTARWPSPPRSPNRFHLTRCSHCCHGPFSPAHAFTVHPSQRTPNAQHLEKKLESGTCDFLSKGDGWHGKSAINKTMSCPIAAPYR
jgi:hypothetical protein